MSPLINFSLFLQNFFKLKIFKIPSSDLEELFILESSIKTSFSCSSKERHVWLPIKPVPPVKRIFSFKTIYFKQLII